MLMALWETGDHEKHKTINKNNFKLMIFDMYLLHLFLSLV